MGHLPATLLLGIATALLSGCAVAADCRLLGNRSPTGLETRVGSPNASQPLTIPSVTPTLATFSSYQLSNAQLGRLGSPTAPFVISHQVILQRFVNGVMIIFAKSDKGFDRSGGEFIFALGKDGRAWRSVDTFVETSRMADNWYTCERRPGQRPEKSGSPWRGFGKVWCDHSEVRSALGNASGYEEADIDASFQDYERGRAFQITDWRGIPGWDKDDVYVVYLDSVDANFASGRWE